MQSGKKRTHQQRNSKPFFVSFRVFIIPLCTFLHTVLLLDVIRFNDVDKSNEQQTLNSN